MAGVIRGLDGWLFLGDDTNDTWKQYRGEFLLDDAKCQRWQEEFQRRGDLMRRLNLHYRFVIAPNKEVSLPTVVPPEYGAPAPRRIMHQVLNAAAGHVHAVVLHHALRSYPDPASLWDRGDTHWNYRGGFVAANHLISTFHSTVGLEQIPEAEARFFEVDVLGDLANKLPEMRPMPSVLGEYRGPAPSRMLFANRINNHGYIAVYERPVPGKTIVVFGDSFAGGIVHWLRHRCRRLVHVHSSAIDLGIIAHERPDAVISITIERFLRAVPEPVTSYRVEDDIRRKMLALSDDAFRAVAINAVEHRSAPTRHYAAMAEAEALRTGRAWAP